jgi:hypothetical protein
MDELHASLSAGQAKVSAAIEMTLAALRPAPAEPNPAAPQMLPWRVGLGGPR